MSKIITPLDCNDQLKNRLDQEANLLKQFFAAIAKAGKTLTIQFRSGTGQLSACKVTHVTPKDIPQRVYLCAAWAGIKFIDYGKGVDFYRTETVECRNAFVVWVKEKLAWLIEQVKKPAQDFNDMTTLVVPVGICFTSGTRFRTV
ncbi:TPA: hypothetical protein DEP94_01025 [Candidatus Nomurabacteria bacterium]|nr:hypothetical protein [Candidatus Nomurabacteria bacterium]